MKSIFLMIFLLAMFNHMDVMHKPLTSDKSWLFLDTKGTSLHDPWLFLDTDNSQHKVWVKILISPDVSLFHNPTMPNDAIGGKLDTEPAKHPLSETAGVWSQEVVSKFSRHLSSMEKHYDVFKVQLN